MSVTAQQVAALNYGDIITLTGHDEPGVITTGPVSEGAGGSYWLGARIHLGDFAAVNLPSWASRDEATLTVVSRAPRPLYVNHPRTELVVGDVVQDASRVRPHHFVYSPTEQWVGAPWLYFQDGRPIREMPRRMPDRLRLLVDGETGQVVPALPESEAGCSCGARGDLDFILEHPCPLGDGS